jgi:hypothetical protein
MAWFLVTHLIPEPWYTCTSWYQWSEVPPGIWWYSNYLAGYSYLIWAVATPIMCPWILAQSLLPCTICLFILVSGKCWPLCLYGLCPDLICWYLLLDDLCLSYLWLCCLSTLVVCLVLWLWFLCQIMTVGLCWFSVMKVAAALILLALVWPVLANSNFLFLLVWPGFPLLAVLGRMRIVDLGI